MDRPMPKPAELSKRLRLALDRAAIRRGAPVQFPEVRAFLTGQGLHISRARWAYFLAGSDIQTNDRALLAALSDLLDVPSDYFYTDDIPENLADDVDQVVAMRAAKVHDYAARALGGLAPEALDAIAEVLRDIERGRGRGRGRGQDL